MRAAIDQFFIAFRGAFPLATVYSDRIPKEMITSPVDKEGWVEWKIIDGTLQRSDYEKIEKEYHVIFPPSFVEWHKAYFFLRCDCSMLRLPSSNPQFPLKEINKNLDWYIPQQLIPQKLYPFADEGNDAGPLVFDGRTSASNNEFPIRVYDHEYGGDLEGLSEIIFSSFDKLLECMTHFMMERKARKDFEIIPEFFRIDPAGAGKTGIDYWLGWTNMTRANFEEFGY